MTEDRAVSRCSIRFWVGAFHFNQEYDKVNSLGNGLNYMTCLILWDYYNKAPVLPLRGRYHNILNSLCPNWYSEHVHCLKKWKNAQSTQSIEALYDNLLSGQTIRLSAYKSAELNACWSVRHDTAFRLDQRSKFFCVPAYASSMPWFDRFKRNTTLKNFTIDLQTVN